MSASVVARRKAVRKKLLSKWPGRNMLWFNGVLHFVDDCNKPMSLIVPEAKIVTKESGSNHRPEATERKRNLTIRHIRSRVPSDFY
ncbi:MAG: hypothetical protein WC639_04885 [Patescibacteria group bacterium]